VPSDKLTTYLEDPELSEHVHRTRPDNTASCFYAFNFYPRFDPKYEPENWAKAVANENFRLAIMYAIDRISLLSIYEPNYPQMLLCNTVTPSGALYVNGQNYAYLPELEQISTRDSYNLSLQRYYRKMARKELREAGVKLPIKILMPYDPSIEGWGKEADKIAVQIEAALGRNFVDVIVEAGTSTGFDMSVIHSGKYALTKCSVSGAYYDPQTFTKPFVDDSNYIFWDKCEDPAIQDLNEEWNVLVERAAAITTATSRRYSAFAKAEKLLISHAIIIPFSILNGDGYEMCKLNEFEGEFSHYGHANQRYKYLKLHEKSMNMDEYHEAYMQWLVGFFEN
jgi:peptide/nickel transport system substrate-binding protein/oligopeptide transport system substrate-binding protein